MADLAEFVANLTARISRLETQFNRAAPAILPGNWSVNFARLLGVYFDETELNEAMMELNIDPGRVQASSHQATATKLVTYCERHGLSQRLIELCQRDRPHVDWPVM